MNKLLDIINAVIAIVLVAALGMVYWFFWRPVSDSSGTVKAPVAAETSVTRDRLGVPHIQASNLDDLLFAQGYTTASDRLWQMDSLRRFSAGDLSEVVGPAGLQPDREARRLRTRRLAEEIYADLGTPERAAFGAYARGVNHYIATHRGQYSPEFTILGYDPMPWSETDTILIGLYMYRALTNSWEDELKKRNMLSAGNPAKVQLLWPVRTGRELAPGGDLHPGSNAWVVSGAHTASGKPILSNDMHLEWSVPGIWFMAHLQAPGIDVAGVTLPGVPGVIAGHNERIAWGMTNVGFDVQDLYIEKFDPQSGRYLFQGKVEQARQERELIRVKGAKPEEFTRWVTVHGPIMVAEGREFLSLKWTAAQKGLFAFPFLDLDRAGNWSDFTKALARMPGPAQNFVYADVDGNIGYHAAGKLPIRRKANGDLPVDGSSGEFEWDGYIPFEELPSAYNPKDGLIVTANQDPFPADYAYHVNGRYPAEYRSQQIRQMLTAAKALRPEDTLKIQKDVYSGFAHFFSKQLVQAVDRRKATNPNFTDAVAMLRNWDGQMDKEHAEPFIVTLAFQYFRKFVAESAAPGKGPVWETEMSSGVLQTLLTARPAGWFENWDLTLEKALGEGIDEGRRMQGDAVTKWRYGKYLEITLVSPVEGKIPWVGKYFNVGPTEMSGSSTSVKQTSQRLGPSMRMNADLSDWDKSLLNITVGQSEHRLSPHNRDQWDAYYAGKSFRMQFQKVDAKGVLKLSPGRE